MYSPAFLRLNGKVRFATNRLHSSHGEKLMDGKRHLKICTLAALALALGAGTAAAQDKTFELKLSHWVPPSHPLQKAIEEWGDDIQKESNGTITYKIFPAQQLGKAFDHYD